MSPIRTVVTHAAPSITAEDCWELHRLVLGGVSSVTGAPLPESIASCPLGAQKAHFAFAVLANLAAGRELPAAPAGIDEAEVKRIVDAVHDLLRRRPEGDVQER